MITNNDTAQPNAAGKHGTKRTHGSAPETVTISLPALRSVILGVIDDGCTCNSGEKHPWELDDTTAEELNITNQQRLRFADAICDRLRQLPVRG